jgi:outer membrane lipoprotein SlyB
MFISICYHPYVTKSLGRQNMKNTLFAALVAISSVGMLSACTTTEKGAVGGAVVGAVAGQVIGRSTEATLLGAAIGAVGGAVAGELIGRQKNGNCVYQRPNGTQFIAKCPA